MDSFSILGIARDASPAEIKRAYRRMAMAWHPDRSTHPEATERFKQIRAAYDSLQNRLAPSEDAAAPEPARESEPEAPRAADIRLDLEVSLEEAAFGCVKTVELDRGCPCATCGGSGEAGLSRSRPCSACHGSGRIRHRQRGLERCPECEGRGFFRQRICPDCAGRGRHRQCIGLQVRVPAGMLSGDELRLAGQGEPGQGELAAGDLFLKVAISPHPLFDLQGCDLAYAMPVNALWLLAGGKIEVPGLAGAETLEIAPGDIAPRTLRIAGKGYPGRRQASAGDLVIELNPIMPQKIDAQARQWLQQAAIACETGLGESLPEIAAWRRHHGL